MESILVVLVHILSSCRLVRTYCTHREAVKLLTGEATAGSLRGHSAESFPKL